MTDSSLPLREGQEVTREVDLGDLDNDGDLDILFANVTSLISGGNAQNRILLNNGAGVFVDVTDSNYPVSNERSFEGDLIDLDSDGDLDIITGNLPKLRCERRTHIGLLERRQRIVCERHIDRIWLYCRGFWLRYRPWRCRR